MLILSYLILFLFIHMYTSVSIALCYEQMSIPCWQKIILNLGNELRIWHKRDRSHQPHRSFKCTQFYPKLCTFQAKTELIFLHIYSTACVLYPSLIITNILIQAVSFCFAYLLPVPIFLCLQRLCTMFQQVNSSVCFAFSSLSLHLPFTAPIPFCIHYWWPCFRSISTYSLKNLKLIDIHID